MTEPNALAVYAQALTGRRPLRVRHADGTERAHDVRCWTRDADPTDLALLARCDGPTLDLGCGPGRLVAALAGRGVAALGIDVSGRAVAMARARGAAAIRRDLFNPLPGEGRWNWALLIDGNIGIGGAPERLLARVRRLLRPGGAVLVEVSPDDVDRRGPVRLVGVDGTASSPFRWAELGRTGVRRIAEDGGWSVAEEWQDGEREFAHLVLSDPACSPPGGTLSHWCR
jgi:SAM-dependent methyltransferase